MARLLRLGLFAAAFATAVPIVLFAVAQALAPQTTDFMCFWSGSAVVLRGADPYEPATWSAAVDGLFPNWLGLSRRPPCPGSYAYPLWTAVATLPLGMLPLQVAALVWMVLLVGGIAAGLLLLARAAGLSFDRTLFLVAVTLASQPAWLTALTSQYGGLDLLGLGLLSLDRTARRPAPFALGTGLLLLKPHIAPVVVLERARAATPRALATALAGVLAIILVSVVVRPTWPIEWLDELIGHRSTVAATSATLYGLTTWLTGEPWRGVAVALLATGAFVLALFGRHVSDALDRVAIALTISLLLVPYLSSGDPIVLAVVWCAVLRRAGPRPIGTAIALIVVADVVPWLLYAAREAASPPGDIRNAIELPIAAALLAVALRRPRRTSAS